MSDGKTDVPTPTFVVLSITVDQLASLRDLHKEFEKQWLTAKAKVGFSVLSGLLAKAECAPRCTCEQGNHQCRGSSTCPANEP